MDINTVVPAEVHQLFSAIEIPAKFPGLTSAALAEACFLTCALGDGTGENAARIAIGTIEFSISHYTKGSFCFSVSRKEEEGEVLNTWPLHIIPLENGEVLLGSFLQSDFDTAVIALRWLYEKMH